MVAIPEWPARYRVDADSKIREVFNYLEIGGRYNETTETNSREITAALAERTEKDAFSSSNQT